GVEVDQEVDGAVGFEGNFLEVSGEQRALRAGGKIRRKLGLQIVGILERPRESGGVDKEIERIDHGHLRREVDLDLQFVRLLREDEACEPVALRVLLPVHKV